MTRNRGSKPVSSALEGREAFGRLNVVLLDTTRDAEFNGLADRDVQYGRRGVA